MAKLFGYYLRVLRSVMKILSPLALLACLVMPLYGHLVRWAPAEQALLRYKNETAVMVAGSYQYDSTVLDNVVKSSAYRERVYVLFPSMFSEPKTVRVSQMNDEPYKILEIHNGVFDMLIMYGLIVFGVWWFWLRRPGKP
jgi:hypothetical protein